MDIGGAIINVNLVELRGLCPFGVGTNRCATPWLSVGLSTAMLICKLLVGAKCGRLGMLTAIVLLQLFGWSK